MRSWLFLACIASFTTSACGKGDKPPPPQGSVGLTQESGPRRNPSTTTTPTPNAGDPDLTKMPDREPTAGEKLYLQTCQRCHGLDGTGKTDMASTLNPKPRDYTNPEWQASITDDYMKQIIVRGGQAMGKSPMMPPNPDLEGKPELVSELVQIIRNYGRGAKFPIGTK